MKKCYTFLLVFIFLTCIQGYSQLDSVKIIPSNPTVTDTIKVIAYTTFSSGGCALLNSSVTQSTGVVNVSACHENGIAAYICNSVDTIVIGLLPAGSFNLTYTIKRANGTSLPPSCNGATALDSETSAFVVTGSSAIEKNELDILAVNIFPNPAQNNITVMYNFLDYNGLAELVMYNMVGQVVKRVPFQNKSGALVEDVSTLSRGAYFYRVETPSFMGSVGRLNIVD